MHQASIDTQKIAPNQSVLGYQYIAEAYLYDVDGVLTDASRQVDPHLLKAIAQQLANGHVMGLNSKRSLPWLIEHIIHPLESLFSDKAQRDVCMQRVMAVGELGSVWMTFTDQSEKAFFRDTPCIIPKPLLEEVNVLVREKFTDLVFVDHSKETMISVERLMGVPDNDYHRRQPHLVDHLQALLHDHSVEQIFQIDANRFGTDIEIRDRGKAIGARRFFGWLQSKQWYPLR
jgi:hypothetical protein